jgi:hypothetical protein
MSSSHPDSSGTIHCGDNMAPAPLPQRDVFPDIRPELSSVKQTQTALSVAADALLKR